MAYRVKFLAAKLIIIADQACDVQDLDTAWCTLKAADDLFCGLKLIGRDREYVLVRLLDVHRRLWILRHPDYNFQVLAAVPGPPASVVPA